MPRRRESEALSLDKIRAKWRRLDGRGDVSPDVPAFSVREVEVLLDELDEAVGSL